MCVGGYYTSCKTKSRDCLGIRIVGTKRSTEGVYPNYVHLPASQIGTDPNPLLHGLLHHVPSWLPSSQLRYFSFCLAMRLPSPDLVFFVPSVYCLVRLYIWQCVLQRFPRSHRQACGMSRTEDRVTGLGFSSAQSYIDMYGRLAHPITVSHSPTGSRYLIGSRTFLIAAILA